MYSREEDTKIKKTQCATASLTKAMTTERQLNNCLRSTRSYLICAKDRNIITNTLHEKARMEFIKRGGRNLIRDEDNVLDLLEEIQDGIEE